MAETISIILLCGIGTFLLRWLPFRRARYRVDSTASSSVLQRWLAAVGPAAIASLFAASVVALPDMGTDTRRMLMVSAALSCVMVVRRLSGSGVVVPTLSGAVAYGVLFHLVG